MLLTGICSTKQALRLISINRTCSQVISYRSGAFLAVKFRQKYKSKGSYKTITIINILLYKCTHFS